MKQNFSWLKSSLEYIKMYKEILGKTTDLTTDEQEKLEKLTVLNS
jgi:starch synthase